MPISDAPASCMIVRTSAKSRLIRPGIVIRSVMPWTPWRSTSSASRKASMIEVRRSTTWIRRSLGMTMTVSTCFCELGDALLGAARALGALELERPGDDADGQRALLAGDLRDHRRRAGAGAAALAGGDEDHVRAADGLLDLLAALLGGVATRPAGRRRRRGPW